MDIIEEISELIHGLWVEFTQDTCMGGYIDAMQVKEWRRYWTTYKRLNPKDKEEFREKAIRFMTVMDKYYGKSGAFYVKDIDSL